jgi:hypothetical protein
MMFVAFVADQLNTPWEEEVDSPEINEVTGKGGGTRCMM